MGPFEVDLGIKKVRYIYHQFLDEINSNQAAFQQLQAQLSEHLADNSLSDKISAISSELDQLEQELQRLSSTDELKQAAAAFHERLGRFEHNIQDVKDNFEQSLQQRLTTEDFNTEKSQLDAKIAANTERSEANREDIEQLLTKSNKQLSNKVTELNTALNQLKAELAMTISKDELNQIKKALSKNSQPDQLQVSQQLNMFHRSFVGQVSAFAGAKAPAGWLAADGATVQRGDYPDLWAFAQASGNLAASASEKTAGQFGPGDGETSFSLPDLRGEFIRGVTAERALGSTQADAIKAHSHSGQTTDAGAHTHSASSDYQGAHRHAGETAHAGAHTHSGSTNHAGGHSHSAKTSEAGTHGHRVKLPQRGGSSTNTGSNQNLFSNLLNLSGSSLPEGWHTHDVVVDNSGAHSHSLNIPASGNHQHSFNTQSAGNHQHQITLNQQGAHQHALVIASTGEDETRPRNIALLFCIKY